MARAKQTGRAEARRRYRQAGAADGAGADDGAELDYGERKSDKAKSSGQQGRAAERPSTGRVGFFDAFRQAYHPAHPLADIRALPSLLVNRWFLAAVGLIAIGAAVVLAFPNYTGSRFAWELLVFPGSALAPQLLAGFFAPRASYLLGLIIGLLQGVVFTIFLTQFGDRLGAEITSDQIGSLLSASFLSGPVSGALFASAAAWYRRFLALSSPRRAPAAKSTSRRSGSR